MTYTRGVLENAIYQVYSRINALTASGESLYGIKSVLVGSRSLTIGNASYPMIIIDVGDGFDQTPMNTAYNASEKETTLPLEIHLIVEKLMSGSAGVAAFATNTLFDSAGNGPIAWLQKLMDALVYDASGNYDPTMGLSINKLIDLKIRTWADHEKHIEIICEADLLIRHTNGLASGVSS